jgi:hypothetical protein
MQAKAHIRSMAMTAVVLLAGASLQACGASSSASGESSAARQAEAKDVIRQALAVNPKADSARISLTIDGEVQGIPRLKGPIEVTVDGRYNLPDGATAPDVEFDVGLFHNGHALGGGLKLVDGTAYVTLGSTGYKIPDDITRKLMAPAADAKNGLTKTGAMFHVNPQDWQKDAQRTGTTKVAGVDVDVLEAGIRLDRAFLDLDRFVRFLASLGVTQAVGLPGELGPEIRAALERSVTDARGKVWIGSDDHVLRKAQLVGRGAVAPRDRELLYGATGAQLEAILNITDVGVAQEISVPRHIDSYASLQGALSALGQSIRHEVRAARREAHAASR